MRRRVGRPGLLGTVARTAAVAGTATAVSGGVRRRQANRDAEQQQAAMAEQQQQQAEMDPAANRAAAQQAAPAPAAGDDPVAKIKQLAELRDSGVLTEQEFTAAKAKLLGV